jgi:DNA-binding response OmpR family regulator
VVFRQAWDLAIQAGTARLRVLIAEDDRKMAELVRRGLEEAGHTARVAHDGPSALEMGLSSPPDTIVLDIMLPGMDGYEFTRRLRKEGSSVPVLMLTARDAVADVVKGLNVGADDYLTKPFSLKILIARLEALARRASAAPSNRLQVADLIIDFDTHQVWRGGVRIPLSRTEFEILTLLMRRAGRVVTRDALIDSVWGAERPVENNTLDAFIRLLRTKIETTGSKKLIQTVRGVGYSIRDQAW